MLMLLTTVTPTTALPPGFGPAVKVALQPVIDAAARYYNVSFSVGVASSSGSFGLAAGLDGTAPMTPKSKIPMGSATKIYTSTFMLGLQERGLLDLDKSAAELVDPFLMRTNGTTLAQLWGTASVNAITVRQLLGMRSGLNDYDDHELQSFCLDPSNFKLDITPYDYLHRWAKKQILFPPGKGGAYSSIGFVVLGFVLAAVTNQTVWTGLDQRTIIPEPLRHDPDLAGLTFAGLGLCSA